ncbi:hypothetical protein CFP56_028557 [Quercus suber]|uniref:Uncharacterized protein n=1 Tax=Quercus suber TaxID=58331 RepID=A0AAW0JTP7_QUESU
MPRKRSYSSQQTHRRAPRHLLNIDAEMNRDLPSDLERDENQQTHRRAPRHLLNIDAQMNRDLPRDLERDENIETGTEEEEEEEISTDVSRRAASMQPDFEFLGIQNNEGNTALHLALINKYREVDLVLKTKYSEIASFLVETNPKVSYCPNEEHKSPLYMAAEAGDAEMVKFMIEKADGINMAMVDGGGRVLEDFDEVKLIAHAAITGRNIDEDHPTFSSCNLAFTFIETTCGKGNRVYFSSLSHTLSREGHSIHQIEFLTNALLTHPSVNFPDQVPLIMMIITWNSGGAM